MEYLNKRIRNNNGFCNEICTCLPCLQAAYVENLNGSQLFDSMYAEDSDGQKINKLPAVEELLLAYPLLRDQN